MMVVGNTSGVAPFTVGATIGLTRYPIEYMYLPLLAWAGLANSCHWIDSAKGVAGVNEVRNDLAIKQN